MECINIFHLLQLAGLVKGYRAMSQKSSIHRFLSSKFYVTTEAKILGDIYCSQLQETLELFLVKLYCNVSTVYSFIKKDKPPQILSWKFSKVLGTVMILKNIFIQLFQNGKQSNPANIYLFKVKNVNTRKRCEICSKLTIKILELYH